MDYIIIIFFFHYCSVFCKHIFLSLLCSQEWELLGVSVNYRKICSIVPINKPIFVPAVGYCGLFSFFFFLYLFLHFVELWDGNLCDTDSIL